MSTLSPSLTEKIKPKDFFAKVGETFIARIVTIAIGLIVSIIIARLLGPEGQGIYASAVALAAVAVQLGNLGLSTSNTYVSAQSKSYVTSLTGNSLMVILICGTFINLILIALKKYDPLFIPIDGSLFYVSLFWIYPGLLLLFSQSILLGLQNIRLINTIDISHRLIHISILGLFIYLGLSSVFPLFLCLFIALTLISVYSFYEVLKAVHFKFPFPSLKLLRSTAIYGLSAYLAALFSYLCLRFDLLMVKAIEGSASAGFYSIAVSISDVVYTLPVVVGTVLFAKLSNLGSFDEKRKFALRILILLGVVVLVGCFVASLLVDYFLPLLYGEKYRPSIEPFLYLLPGMFFLSLSTVIQNFIAAAGRSWLMFVGPLVAFLVNIPLNFLWIPQYGATGAAMASSVVYGLWLGIGLIIFFRLKSHNQNDLPSIDNENDFILTIYPLTEKGKEDHHRILGRPIEVLEISTLVRSVGIKKLYFFLRKKSINKIYYYINESEKNNLIEIICAFSLFSGATELIIFSENNQQILGRKKMFMTSFEVISSSVAGLFSLFKSALLLITLLIRKPLDLPFKDIKNVFFLKTNLWFGVKAGGSVGHVAGVVNGFQRLGYPVTCGAISTPLMVDQEVEFLPLEFNRTFGYPIEINNYLYSFEILEKLKQQKYSKHYSVIYQRLALGNFSGVILSRLWRIPLVMEYNGSEVWVSAHWGKKLKFHRIADWCERVCLKHAQLIVTVSDVLRDELIQKGISVNKIVSYPNCIDPQIFDPKRFNQTDSENLRSKYGLTVSDTIITFVGTFGKWHGVNILADTIAFMVKNHQDILNQYNVKFLLVGDGGEMPYVRSVLDNTECNKFVTLTGLIDQHLAPLYLYTSDILVSPHVPNQDGSRFFGSPTKLFEYMAMKRPIIASDLEQIAEIFQGSVRIDQDFTTEDLKISKALMMKPNSVTDFTKAIIYLLQNKEPGQTLSTNARVEALNKYTWAIHVKEIIKGMRFKD